MCSICPHDCWLSLSQPSFTVHLSHLAHVSHFYLCQAHLSSWWGKHLSKPLLPHTREAKPQGSPQVPTQTTQPLQNTHNSHNIITAQDLRNPCSSKRFHFLQFSPYCPFSSSNPWQTAITAQGKSRVLLRTELGFQSLVVKPCTRAVVGMASLQPKSKDESWRKGMAAPPAHWKLQQVIVIVLCLSAAMITWDRRTFESQEEFPLQFSFFQKTMLWVAVTKVEDILVIFDSFIFLQILSRTSFQWPFPFFLPFVTVKGRREGSLKLGGTGITEWRRIIQDLLAWFIF